MLNLREKYEKQIAPKLMELFGYKNKLAAPKLTKVIINVGINATHANDDKFKETAASTLARITGQKPVFTKAKKSISAFKVREGMTVGLKVTLRGQKMYDFVDKLVNISLPRVRDFRGLDKKSLGRSKCLTLGFKEHIVFPEIKSDEVERMHGLEVTVVSNAKNEEEAFQLFSLLGFPFKEEEKKSK